MTNLSGLTLGAWALATFVFVAGVLFLGYQQMQLDEQARKKKQNPPPPSEEDFKRGGKHGDRWIFPDPDETEFRSTDKIGNDDNE